MKKLYFLIIAIGFASCASSKQIPQAQPFASVLKAIDNNSEILFKNAFSTKVQMDKKDTLSWNERLSKAREKFKSKFNNYTSKDFSFGFSQLDSKLIVNFKGNEMFRMKVLQENGDWKLDEH